MNNEERILVAFLIKIGVSIPRISRLLGISKFIVYRYLKKNPISEQELNNFRIDKSFLLNLILSNYSQSEKIKHTEIKEAIQEVKGSNNDIVSEEDMKRAYEKLNEYNRKRGIFN